MSADQVVVTGVGTVTALGHDAAAGYRAWLAGASAVTAAAEPEYSELPVQLEGRVTGFDRRRHISNRMLRKLLSPSAGYAVAAAAGALDGAGLLGDAEALRRCGLYVGSLSLEIDPDVFIPPLRASLSRDGEFDISLFARRGMRLLDPLFLVRALPNAGVCGISVEHQVLGPNTNLTNGPTSGLASVALAAAAVARGELSCAVAGGYDTLLTLDNIAELLIADRISRYGGDPAQACRPYSADRDGLVPGEGAAFVVVESARHAASRGVPPLAVLDGWGETTDPGLMRGGADATALEMAAATALRQAHRSVTDLGAVFTDGLGTRDDDLREARALRALGSVAPVTAATSAVGFTGAAGGVVSLAHAALAVSEGTAPALANCADPDPECDVPFATSPTSLGGDSVLVLNSDRGVKNVAVVASRA